jgi:hypothetical protein
MMADLAMASWETIARRTAMIARGTCSPAEYQCMITEKAAALQQSAIAENDRERQESRAPAMA